MIFKSTIGKTVWVLIIILLVLVGKLFYQYSIYQDIRKDYYLFTGEDIDPITHDKLVKSRGTHHDYFRCSGLSMRKAGEERIVFTGLCQDHGGKVLKMWLPLLKKLGAHFKDYVVLIVENDSVDNTRECLLQEAQKNDKFIVLCGADKPENTQTCKLGRRSVEKGGDKEKNLEERTSMLASFREVYWGHVLKKYSDYDYMCVIDWDLEGLFPTTGFFHGLHYVRNNADVVACNSFHKMGNVYHVHDTYPLLNHHRCDHLKENKTTEDLRAKMQMRDKLLCKSFYPVPVESAFGGVALYNIQNLRQKNAHYTDTPLCPIECEHTTFHKNLHVYIDPWMTFYITKNHH